MGICWGAPCQRTRTNPPAPELSKHNSNDGAITSTKSLPTFGSSTSKSKEYSDGHIITTPNLKVYSFQELKSATRNFRGDLVLGEGGFGRVFKCWIDEKTLAPTKLGTGIMVAVKRANPNSMQGLEEWQSEVDFLGRLSHPNLVKLIGYCREKKEYLLVYEFAEKGSLENHLFRRGGPAGQPLSWDIRLKIAIGAARGLAFLHASQEQVIYRDFKSSNILLDGDFNAKISDFGLAKRGPANGDSHVTTRVMGTYGYAAPEYIHTGHLYVRSDVYGFGVVLLEMLTGQRANNTNHPGKHTFVEWATPLLSDRKKFRPIMDSTFKDKFHVKGAVKAAQLTLKCLGPDPKTRPSMKEVLDTLEKISSIAKKRK